MTWLVLSNGAEQNLAGPGALQARYTLESVAHQLAQINRYTGATRRPYSVAEHSLLCADLAADAGHTPLVQLCCLMHDAHECITGDMASPVKWHLREAWADFENPHARTLRKHFRLSAAFVAHTRLIHHIDLMALATERRELLPYQPGVNAPWPVIDTPGQEVHAADGYHLRSMWREQRHWTEWRDAFLERYEQLGARVDAQARQWREARA
jgi:hypothetical protein